MCHLPSASSSSTPGTRQAVLLHPPRCSAAWRSPPSTAASAARDGNLRKSPPTEYRDLRCLLIIAIKTTSHGGVGHRRVPKRLDIAIPVLKKSNQLQPVVKTIPALRLPLVDDQEHAGEVSHIEEAGLTRSNAVPQSRVAGNRQSMTAKAPGVSLKTSADTPDKNVPREEDSSLCGTADRHRQHRRSTPAVQPRDRVQAHQSHGRRGRSILIPGGRSTAARGRIDPGDPGSDNINKVRLCAHEARSRPKQDRGNLNTHNPRYPASQGPYPQETAALRALRPPGRLFLRSSRDQASQL